MQNHLSDFIESDRIADMPAQAERNYGETPTPSQMYTIQNANTGFHRMRDFNHSFRRDHSFRKHSARDTVVKVGEVF